MLTLAAGPAATMRSSLTTTTAFEIVVAFVTSIIRAARMAVACWAVSGARTIKISATTNANIFRFILRLVSRCGKLTRGLPAGPGQDAQRGRNAFDGQLRRSSLMQLTVALVEWFVVEVKCHSRGALERHFTKSNVTATCRRSQHL